jgi:hypothetical protein
MFFSLQARSQNCEKWPLASSYVSVRPSAWNKWAPTGRIFMKFDIWVFLEDLSKKSSFIKIWQEEEFFTWRPAYIYDISLSSA